jgi:histidine ammonia-lyase
MKLSTLRTIFEGSVRLSLSEDAWPAIRASAETVERVISSGRTVYGINTGFGLLASTRINEKDLQLLQDSLVMSHAAGTGDLLDPSTVRLIMALKINSLAQGYSGVTPATLETLVNGFNAGIIPAIPAKGSVGASGDLAPLAHLAATFMGIGKAFYQGQLMEAQQALRAAGLSPLKLAPKEGLALLNGTNVSTGLAIKGLFEAEQNFAAAVLCGALSVDAAAGSDTPFDDRIHAIRGHQGQRDVAAVYRKLLAGSAIRASHKDCERVQDPYSLRCQPQVMGAILDQMRHCAHVLLTEANAVSDNPLVFAEDGDILSGGNFHAEPVALAADSLAVAIAEIGAISERRIALLMDKHLSGLPAFLVENGGVNSGFMIIQVTAAALASENKSLAHPASVDSLPTSANQEDHVSMATFAARRLADLNDNVNGILAVEYLSAAQGVDFRRPLKSSALLEQFHARLRSEVPHYEKDRFIAPDIERAKHLLKDPTNIAPVLSLLPSYG